MDVADFDKHLSQLARQMLPLLGLRQIHRWSTAVELQARRLMELPQGSGPERAPLHVPDVEGDFFLAALRNLRRALVFASKDRECWPTDVGSALSRAITSFDQVVGDAEAARNVLQHFDEYERHKGGARGENLGYLSGTQLSLDEHGEPMPAVSVTVWRRGQEEDVTYTFLVRAIATWRLTTLVPLIARMDAARRSGEVVEKPEPSSPDPRRS